MFRTAVATFVSALAVAGAAFAGPGVKVEQSRGVYHISVCPGPVAPNTARCHAHVVTDKFGTILTHGDATRNGAPSGYGPPDLRSAYNVPTSTSTAIIAIVDAYGYTNAETDLGKYRAYYGLPACTTANGCFGKYNQSGVKGSYPSTNVGWAQETALDLDMASAMCPTCKIILVEANSASYANLGTAVNTAARLKAHVISNSYGGGESGTTSYVADYDHPGVAITASSGDSGYGVQFPASAPYVTAVGGTSLVRSSNARGWSETAWSGAGSGCSTVYAIQSWQVGVTDKNCAGHRMEADVSAIADPSTGVAVYAPTSKTASSWQVYGGTSVAAPLIAGLYAANGGSVTYGSNPYANVGSLNDVVGGGNGSCGGTYLCTAVTGYDGPTGLGTPNGDVPF
jgi:subtilase family serine protease